MNGRLGRSLLLAALALGGCALPLGGPSRPAPLLHLVYFRLVDPSQAEALLDDSERLLMPIPTVVSYAAGRHVDIGRDSVEDDYDVALLVGFRDVAGYRAYLQHPRHLELLAIWKERLAGITIYDVGDEPRGGPSWLPR